MKNKILSLAIVLCMIVGIAALPVGAEITEGYFTYYVTLEKEAIITSVDPQISGDVVVPSTTNAGYWVKGIGERAFNGCNGITSLTIGDVAEIDSTAFMLSGNIESITVLPGNNYYSSEDGVLFNADKTVIISCPCGKSGDYIIPDTVEEIGEWAFYSCENLTSVTIPNGVQTISCEAFSYCTGLETMSIPDGVKTIDSAAFAGCFGLCQIKIPDSVIYINEYAFDECESLSVVFYQGTMQDWNNIKISDGNDRLTDAEIYCKDGIIGQTPAPASSGGGYLGGVCGELASWELTNGILTIEGTGKLYECEWQSYPWYQYRSVIDTVIIYDGIESVPTAAFDEEYDSLTTVYIAPSVTQIGDGAFYNDDNLKDLYFYGDAPNIGGKSIAYNEDLVLHYLDTASGWTDSANYDSTTNKWYGHKLAGWLNGEGKVEVSGSNIIITKDGVCTLYSASGKGYCPTRDQDVTKIVLSETVKSIPEVAFDGCTLDVVLSLPKTLKTIGGYAFARCPSISLELDPLNPYIKLVDGILYSADMTELIYASPKLTGNFVTPPTVTTVHDGAFVFSRFDSITISDNVTSMGEYIDYGSGNVWFNGRVFANAQCKHVLIGRNVSGLGNCCFYMCPNLEDVTFLGLDTKFADDDANCVVMYSGRGEIAFGGDAGTGIPAKLYCYKNSYAAQHIQNYEGEWEYLDEAENEKPTAPETAPTVQARTTTSITIDWTPGTDDVEVAGYNIYVNNELVGSTEDGNDYLSYNIQNLKQGQEYQICVQTVDCDDQVSDLSPVLSASTVGLSVQAPNLDASYITDEYPYGIKISSTVSPDVTTYAVNLKRAVIKYRLIDSVASFPWNEQSLNVSGADIYGNLNVFAYPQMATTVTPPIMSYIQFPEGTYEVCIEAEDTNGAVVTSQSKYVNMKYDDIPPTKPGIATKTKCNTVSIMLGWTKSTDNVGVDHYVISRDGIEIGTSNTNSFTDTGLTVDTAYRYTVCAVDKRGNISESSDAVSLRTADLKISEYTKFETEYMMEMVPKKYHDKYRIPFVIDVQTDVDMSPVTAYMEYESDAVAKTRIDAGEYDFEALDAAWNIKPGGEYLDEGKYSVVFTVTDGYTYKKTEPQLVQLFRDNVAPVVESIDEPMQGMIYGGRNLTIFYDITDNVGVSVAEAEYSKDGEIYSNIFKKEYTEDEYISDNYVWNVENLESGNYQLRILAFDRMNNIGELVREFGIDHTPPVPVSNAQILGDFRHISINWSHQNPEEGMTYKIYRATSENGEYEEIKKQSKSQFYDDLTTISRNTVYYYKITVLDKYENESEPSEILSAQIISDTEKPTAVISPEELLTAINVPFLFSAVNSTDNDEIASYNWDFGDGTYSDKAVNEHTYGAGGTYTVTLAVTDVSGNTGVISRNITVEDPYANKENYTLVTLNIVDAETSNLTPVSGANLQISYENGDTTTAMSDESGKVKIFMPIGSHIVGVAASNYMPTSKNLMVSSTADGTMEATIGISKTQLVVGEITSKEMTYEEILNAGIDVEALDNQHVWKFSVTLTFHVGLKEYSIPDFLLGWGTDGPDGPYNPFPGRWITLPPSGPGESPNGPNGPYRPSDDTKKIGIFPTTTEGYYLVIYGEAHWLKEMYNVELEVINKSYLDTVKNCVAELNLPDGLSLATMLGNQQTSKIAIGNIDANSEEKAEWFVRGDAEGEYNISATVTGDLVSGSVTEHFEYPFRTSSPIKVYAGSALKMTIIADDVAERGKDYNVKFRLENVSDKSLYNLSFGIKGIEQFKLKSTTKGGITISEEKTVFDSIEFNDTLMREVGELAPGGYFEIEVSVTCWFKSDEEVGLAVAKTLMSAFAVTDFLANYIDIAYYIDGVAVTTLEGSTTTIPCEIVVNRTERDSLLTSLLFDVAKEKLGIEDGSLGGTIIKVAGEGLGLGKVLISGAKNILKLQQGETDYKITITIDDGKATKNSIYNDYVSITTGDAMNSVIDTVNGTKLKVANGEITIQAKLPGTTKIKIGTKGVLEDREIEHTIDLNILNEDFSVSSKLTPTSIEGKYKANENEIRAKIQERTEKDKILYMSNPYMWFDSELKLNIDANTSNSNYSAEISADNISQLLDNSVISKLTYNGDKVSVSFNREAVETIREAIESNNDPSMIVTAYRLTDAEALNMGITQPTYRLAVEDEEGELISDFGDGRVFISLPYVLEDGKTCVVEHIKEDGRKEDIECEYIPATQRIEFYTDSFSYFSIKEVSNSNEEHNSSSTGNTTPSNPSTHSASSNNDGDTNNNVGNGRTNDSGNTGNSETTGGFGEGSGGIVNNNSNSDALVVGTKTYTDVKKNDWFYNAVKFMAEKGITSGVSDSEYAPQAKVTRGQFITMLCRAYGIEEKGGDNFADAGDTWYTDYLAAAKQLGISQGVGDNMFVPEKEITREEMVTLIYNYLKSVQEIEAVDSETEFADNSSMSDWAKQGIAFANRMGYVSGKGDNLFDPKGDATRAELAQIFYNILK